MTTIAPPRAALVTLASIVALGLGLGACSASRQDVPLDDVAPRALAPDVAPEAAAPDAGVRDVAPVIDVVVARDVPAQPPVDAAMPVTVPEERWTWVPVEGARCGNGSATGFGINFTRRSQRLMIFLQGGGACWDSGSCYGAFGAGTAFGIGNPYAEAEFNNEATRSLVVFDRADMRNPFRDTTMVFVPYCTGDVHSGDRVVTYESFGRPVETYHVGFRNMTLILARLAATLPAADRVWLLGVSAGGFGAAFNLGQAHEAFPAARVDVLDDSGPPIDPTPGRYAQWREAWNMQLPRDCFGCDAGPSDMVGYYLARYPDSRFALLSNNQDFVISTFFGLSQTQFESSLRSLNQARAAEPRWRHYVIGGISHVLLLNPNVTNHGVPLLDWLNHFATDTTPWDNLDP